MAANLPKRGVVIASRSPVIVLRTASAILVAAALTSVLALISGGVRPAAAGDPLLVTWGNSNCSGEDHFGQPDPVDSLFILRGDAGLPADTGACPEMGAAIEIPIGSPFVDLPYIWGDFDCSGEMNPVDSLKLLRFDAGLPVIMFENCPPLASQVAVILALALKSNVLAPGATFPVVHTCDGANTSLPLSWENVPPGTVSFALAILDIDANDFVHWAVYEIPAGTTELPAGASTMLPAGAVHGVTSFGPQGYGGPCPPPGPPHEYIITLFALNAELGLAAGATYAQLVAAMGGHIIASASLNGLYAR